MITGDANIAEATMIVQYRVADPSKYLFRLKDSEETLASHRRGGASQRHRSHQHRRRDHHRPREGSGRRRAPGCKS